MSEPVVFVSHFTVKEDKLNELKLQVREVLEMLEAEKLARPRSWCTWTILAPT
jgi:hypothetical protein